MEERVEANKGVSRFHVSMAAEFWFYSQLLRLGYDAYITLGNNKAIDLIVDLKSSPPKRISFDVKAKSNFRNGTYAYLGEPPYPPNHFSYLSI